MMLSPRLTLSSKTSRQLPILFHWVPRSTTIDSIFVKYKNLSDRHKSPSEHRHLNLTTKYRSDSLWLGTEKAKKQKIYGRALFFMYIWQMMAMKTLNSWPDKWVVIAQRPSTTHGPRIITSASDLHVQSEMWMLACFRTEQMTAVI